MILSQKKKSPEVLKFLQEQEERAKQTKKDHPIFFFILDGINKILDKILDKLPS